MNFFRHTVRRGESSIGSTDTQYIIVQKKGTKYSSSALPFYKLNPPQAENYYSLRIGIIIILPIIKRRGEESAGEVSIFQPKQILRSKAIFIMAGIYPISANPFPPKNTCGNAVHINLFHPKQQGHLRFFFDTNA